MSLSHESVVMRLRNTLFKLNLMIPVNHKGGDLKFIMDELDFIDKMKNGCYDRRVSKGEFCDMLYSMLNVLVKLKLDPGPHDGRMDVAAEFGTKIHKEIYGYRINKR